MQLASALTSLLSLGWLLTSSHGLAITTRVGSGIGLMSQPTSAYYHGAYSGYVDVTNQSELLALRGVYWERPKFSSGGYTDQEYGYFAMVGTKLTKQKSHGLGCYIGYGAIAGYLAAENGMFPDAPSNLRTFRLPGPVIELEYAYQWQHFRVAIEQISFTGFGQRSQTDARVAWPYNLLMLNTGVLW